MIRTVHNLHIGGAAARLVLATLEQIDDGQFHDSCLAATRWCADHNVVVFVEELVQREDET